MDEDSDAWLVGFADAEFNTRRYLVLQREKSPRAQEVALGLEGYRVEVDDQRNSCYGGIERFELFPDHIAVQFEDDAFSAIGDRKTIVVGLALRPKQLEQLRECLLKIFRGYECFVDRSA